MRALVGRAIHWFLIPVEQQLAAEAAQRRRSRVLTINCMPSKPWWREELPGLRDSDPAERT